MKQALLDEIAARFNEMEIPYSDEWAEANAEQFAPFFEGSKCLVVVTHFGTGPDGVPAWIKDIKLVPALEQFPPYP